MSREIIRLAPSGIVYDVPPDALDPNVFNAGSNVVFRDGLPKRAMGQQAVYGTPAYAPELLVNLRGPLVNYWVYASQSHINVLDGTSHFDITPVAALTPTTMPNEWTDGTLNGIVVLNNPQNNPVYWPGTTGAPCVTLPGWPSGTKCKALRAFKYHLVALNITDGTGDYPDMVMWSTNADPGAIPSSWTPTPSNQAGFVALAAGGGNLVDAIRLRDSLVIFKDSSTWLMQYVGGNLVMGVRKVLETSGILAPNCAVEIKGGLVILTDSDVVLFDGQSATSIIDGKNRNFLFSQLDPVYYRTAFVVTNWVESEVWVCFPTVGNQWPNVALVWSRDTNSWGIRSINYKCATCGLVAPSTAVPTWNSAVGDWDGYTGIWNQSTYRVTAESILAGQNVTLQNVDASVTDNGTPVSALIQKSGLSLGDPQTRKLITGVWPRLTASAGTEVMIRVGAHDEPNSNIRWADPVPFVIGSQQKIDTFIEGRYLAFELYSNSLQPWTLTGIDIDFSIRGSW